MGKRYRKKPLKRMGAKKLAMKAMRAVNKIEADEETKWKDTGFGTTAGDPLHPEPFTTTGQNNSVLPLTEVEPRQSVNTALGAAIPTINTSNYRDGARIYISGLYLKAQFFWPQIRDTAVQRYPPYANISWAVIREIKNNSAVQPYTPTVYPQPNQIWQDPNTVGQATLPLWNQSQAPLASLLFRNMNNGHNYKILRKGCFCLAAPVMAQQGPAISAIGPSQVAESSFGSRPAALGDNQTLPHQFSNNTVKSLNIKLHPKIKCRYRQLPELPTEQTTLTEEEKVPLENGLYFMYWSDVGANNTDSRFYSQDPATYEIAQPQLVLNTRLRFKDV